MPNHRRYGAIAKRRDQPQCVPSKIRNAKRIKIAVVRTVPSRGASVATLIRGDDVISGCSQWQHYFAPTVGEFREAMQKQDARAPFCFEPGLKHMHRETFDVVDHARTG